MGSDAGPLEEALRTKRAAGRKLLACYLVAGMSPDWLEALAAIEAEGADVIEVGIPFSDPLLDGPVIQEAGKRALLAGFTPGRVLADVGQSGCTVPLVAMTYYNILLRAGLERMAGRLVEAGIRGSIVADLSLEESGPWCEEAEAGGIENIMLVAPPTSVERAATIASMSRGFVYCVATMGVTGERVSLASSAAEVARKVTDVTDKPALVGIGVSTPAQASEVCSVADGVVVGSAIVRRLLDGEGPGGVGRFVAALRSAIDV